MNPPISFKRGTKGARVTTTALIGYCTAILLASIAGGLVPLASALTHTRLQVYLSFAAGVMLGTAFFHVLPESVHLMGGSVEHALRHAMSWTVAGLLSLFFVERFFAFHHHEVSATKHESAARVTAQPADPHPKPVDLAWGPATVGFCIHTLVGGVALASAVATEGRGRLLGFWVFLAILLHKPADSLTITSLMISSGASRARAHGVNVLFALMVPLGAVAFFIGRGTLAHDGESSFTGAVLAFSAGTFLCLSLSDLLPELQFHKHDRAKLSGALLAGIVLMLLAAQFHDP